MTPSKIITAQGTYILEGVGKRIARRVIVISVCILGALFVSAAIIGFTKAATAHSSNRPTNGEFAILHNAEKGGRNCWLEWNDTQNAHEVICK